MSKRKPKVLKWRDSAGIARIQGSLQAAINACTDGCNVVLDIKSAHNLMEVVLQAKHTEEGHESGIENG
jgi:hypothetical protein